MLSFQKKLVDFTIIYNLYEFVYNKYIVQLIAYFIEYDFYDLRKYVSE